MKCHWPALICGSALVASCIDGQEEIWIQRDGSGRAEVSYSLPARAAHFQGGETGIRELLTRFLAKSPALSTSLAEVKTEGNRLHIRVNASFRSVTDLKELAQSPPGNSLLPSAKGLAGTTETHFRGLKFNFIRTINLRNALPGAAFFPASQLEGHQLRYILHLPQAVSSSNATLLSATGRTLTWEIPLQDALKKPILMQFSTPIPLPPWWGKAAIILLALSIFLLVLRIRQKRYLREHKAANNNTETLETPSP